ncbi:glycosyltransferase family 2 protein [Leptolyngbya ohadii]|uniref:glycosyltransferase family 2 protein n=1 Tax=Leptolyngbya ohadii TaxID=1962290 RepID=UPI000B59AFAD|nr:glycosyltransferase [Leptolyngbya ohadii]
MSVSVSVIIPAYNGDRYLTEAIDSALQQTNADLTKISLEIDTEIIVVDDGSTDHTQETLQSYGTQIRSVYQENRGVAAARNRGLELAQGEFIAFLDQDDVWLPNKLALQVACFQSNPETGIVHSGWQLVDAERNFLSQIEPWHEAPVLDLAGWLTRMPILLSAMLFRRTWLERVGLFDSRFTQACDVDLVQRLALLGCQTAWVKQILVMYRQHDRNDSRNTLIQAQESWTVRQQFFAAELPPPIRAIESECYYHLLVWIGWRLFHTGHLPEMKLYLKKALQYQSQPWTETIAEWIDRFRQYEAEYGGTFEVEKLVRSAEWQQLMAGLLHG